MNQHDFGFGTTLTGERARDLDAATEAVTAALKEEGFGVLTTIDVQATLKKKIDVDFRPYRILGACNPRLAHQALEAEPEIGLMLPCNVVVQAADEGVKVSVVDPRAMFRVISLPALEAVAKEADERLRRAVAALEG